MLSTRASVPETTKKVLGTKVFELWEFDQNCRNSRVRDCVTQICIIMVSNFAAQNNYPWAQIVLKPHLFSK